MLEATKTVADGELCAHVAGFAEGLLAPFTFSQLLDRYGIAGINEEVFDEESETCRHPGLLYGGQLRLDGGQVLRRAG